MNDEINNVNDGRTIRVNMPMDDAPLDKTIVARPQDLDPIASGATIRTVMPDPSMQKPMEPVMEEPQGETFLLKGEYYTNVQCLSENTGEAQVFLVKKDGKDYVLKVYYPNFDVNKKLLQTIRSFNFEMIVNLYDFGKTYVDGKHRYYELMEYLRGETLQEYDLGHDFNKFRRLALQAAAALAYCHKNNILHKDIKPGNFFFRDEAHTQLVLGDFGISSMLENDGKAYRTTQARTPIYAAPEMYADVIDGEVEITPAADFYSLGMTLFALWLGENPMSSNERVMMRQKNEGRLPRLDELPPKVKNIVMGLTAVNPPSRWTYDHVERWFLGEDVEVDISSPFLRYKSFIVDPDRNIVADNVHELIPLLMENQKLAINYLYSGRITSWLESCGNMKLSTTVKDIVTNRYPADQKAGLMASIYAMEPSYPYYDILGNVCDDVHAISLSLLSNQDRYALELENPNFELFLWLETHSKADVNRLRTYFGPDADPHVAVMRLVYEIDEDIPFLSRHPSNTVQEISRSFGYGEPTDEDWHALVDGRLLSWMYSHEDVMACESLRILTHEQPFSMSLAYKVLYNLDRKAAYDLREAHKPEDVAKILAEHLKQTEHMMGQDFEKEMADFTDPNGRFYYYAQLHGWNQELADANRCFDMTLEENHERMSAYDLRTALYRYCRILGVTPVYLLPDGTELTDGRNIDKRQASQVRMEIRNGAFAQWLSMFYHEDPTRDFVEEYSYERELEAWVLELGRYDLQQPYYKRYIKAKEETKERINNVRSQWKFAHAREMFWKYAFYGVSAVWLALVALIGITGREYLMSHTILCIVLPLGGMSGIIVCTRAFFKGYGVMMSILWGILGVLSAYIPIFILDFAYAAIPAWFNAVVVLVTIAYMLVCHLTDFSDDTKTDTKVLGQVFNSDDVKTSLIEPLYYTFKTKSYRYKSTKFSLLDDVTDQVHSVSGESVIHYILWLVMMLVLVVEFCMFSPKVLNVKNPEMGEVSVGHVLNKIQQEVE